MIQPDRNPAADISTVIDALEVRSVKQPDETAYVILRDGETPDGSLAYGELQRAARARGGALAAAGLGAADTVVLL
jgi:acyl-CoA synthetase (AMP-forming)/AMP-acid ligase II